MLAGLAGRAEMGRRVAGLLGWPTRGGEVERGREWARPRKEMDAGRINLVEKDKEKRRWAGIFGSIWANTGVEPFGKKLKYILKPFWNRIFKQNLNYLSNKTFYTRFLINRIETYLGRKRIL